MAKEQHTLKSLCREITEQKRTLGSPQSYGAQIISANLRIIAERFGKLAANKVVKELGLERHGWKIES